jgi:hypothetical protein
VNSTNGLIAIAFTNKVCIYGNLKNECYLYSDITIEDSVIKWSIKGDFLVIGGKNNAKKDMYSVYFIETENFETFNVIENITSKIEEIKLIDNDKYLFIRLSSSFIAGMYLNIYNDFYTTQTIYFFRSYYKYYIKFGNILKRDRSLHGLFRLHDAYGPSHASYTNWGCVQKLGNREKYQTSV